MDLFKKSEKNDYTVVIGCGRLGANLADTISAEGRNVLIVDKEKESFRKLSAAFGGLAIVGDGTDFDTLSEAQISKAQVAVVVTNNDNANVMIAQIAREIYHIPRVIARLYDPARECIYKEFGINTICPAELSAKQIDSILESEPIMPASDGAEKQTEDLS
jgi:trk system potassium uptake protein TrkA